METTGEEIRKLRKGAGLTQSDLANLLDVTVAAVSAWEVGKADPTLKNYLKAKEILEKLIAEQEAES